MGMFGRKKKKGSSTKDGQENQDASQHSFPKEPSSISGSIFQQPKSAFSRVFTPKSFKSRGKFPGLPLTPTMSPVSVNSDSNWQKHATSNSNSHKNSNNNNTIHDIDATYLASPDIEDSESFGDVNISHHHGVASSHAMSPAMAAIEARTEQMFRSFRDHPKPSSGDTSPPPQQKRRNSVSMLPESRLDLNDDPSPKSKSPTAQNDGSKPERRWTAKGISMFVSRSKGYNNDNNNNKHDTNDQENSLTSNWLIDFNDLDIGRTIGHSSFGVVSQGKLNGTKVAVKTIQCDSLETKQSIQTEAELNCKLRHPNIVLFMGISFQDKKVCLVTELMVHGNIRDLLSRYNKGKLRLDWSLRQQWALDTALGMAYLHSLDPPMIHRDLKTNNLLVDRGMSVKICDFGLSRLRSDKLMSSVGTVHFSAPEVLKNEMYTESADLFSFGTVMWELHTAKCVFEGMSQIDVYKAVTNGDMPGIDEQCDARYADLVKECWSIEPSKRPTFREVIDRLSVLVDELEEEEESEAHL